MGGLSRPAAHATAKISGVDLDPQSPSLKLKGPPKEGGQEIFQASGYRFVVTPKISNAKMVTYLQQTNFLLFAVQ
jgi:hypothetical protein